MSPFDTRRLSVPGTDAGIRTVLDALEAFATGHGLSKAVTWPREVSLDEIVANVVRHGLDPDSDPPVCEVVVTDDGPEFDPLAAPEPDMSLSVEDRPGVRTVLELAGFLSLFAVEPGREQALARVAGS